MVCMVGEWFDEELMVDCVEEFSDVDMKEGGIEIGGVVRVGYGLMGWVGWRIGVGMLVEDRLEYGSE